MTQITDTEARAMTDAGELPDAPVGEARALIVARVLCRQQARSCNIDVDDNWKTYDEEFLIDAREIVAAMALPPATELANMEAQKDAYLLERNQVVAALAKAFPSGVARTAIEGWSEDWHGCVYIDLPTGQASWHFHDSQAYLFADLPPYEGLWDGHTTEQKYERLAALPPAMPVGEAEKGAGKVQWRCFHCEEVFADHTAAALHFGPNEMRDPACQISIEHVRWLEEQHRRALDEDTEALRTIRGLEHEHDVQRRHAEEEGYAKGLRDGRALQAGEAVKPAVLPADHIREIATRLRRVAHLTGCAAAVPENDNTAVGAIFSVLGLMATLIEARSALAQQKETR